MLEYMSALPNRFAIIVLHFGSAQRTEQCLESLQGALVSGATVVVSCNSSYDETDLVCSRAKSVFGDGRVKLFSRHESIASEISQHTAHEHGGLCYVLGNEVNRGFAAGNNIAGFVALEAQCFDWLWFLNNDTVLEKESFRAMCQFVATKGPTHIVGATVVDMHSPDSVQCAGGVQYNPLLTTISPFLANKQRSSLPSWASPYFDYIYGASICMPVEAFRAVGGFCEDYFLYYEEMDFCRIATANGYSLTWAPEVVVRHEGGGSTKRSGDDHNKKAFAHYHENYSTFVFTKRHHPSFLPFVLLIRLVGKIPILVLRRESYLLPSLFRSMRDFLFRF